MSVDPAQTLALATALPAVVGKAGNASEALDLLVGALRPALPSLWRASLMKLLPDGQQLEYVAVSSVVESQLVQGVHVSALATVYPEVRSLDRPVFSFERTGDPLLVEQIVASEGAGSWAT